MNQLMLKMQKLCFSFKRKQDLFLSPSHFRTETLEQSWHSHLHAFTAAIHLETMHVFSRLRKQAMQLCTESHKSALTVQIMEKGFASNNQSFTTALYIGLSIQ